MPSLHISLEITLNSLFDSKVLNNQWIYELGMSLRRSDPGVVPGIGIIILNDCHYLLTMLYQSFRFCDVMRCDDFERSSHDINSRQRLVTSQPSLTFCMTDVRDQNVAQSERN